MPTNPLQPCVAVLDVGGQGCRLAIFDTFGNSIFRTQASYDTTQAGDDIVEQDPISILKAITHCEHKVGEFVNEAPTIQLVAAGIACQGSNLLAWDRVCLTPLTPVISWQDIRGQSYLNKLPLDGQAIRNITGLWPNAYYGASKYRWCIEHSEAVTAALQQKQLILGPLASFLLINLSAHRVQDGDNNSRRRATHTAVTEPTHAQRTLLCDIRQAQWHPALLAAFHIPEEALPIIVSHDQLASPNQLTSHDQLDSHTTTSTDTKLSIHWQALNCPLQMSMRDQAASLYSEGEPDSTAIYINMGTGIFLQRPIDNTLVNNILTQANTCQLQISPLLYTSTEQHFVIEGSVHSGIACKTALEDIIKQSLNRELVAAALKNIEQLPLRFTLITASGLGSPYWQANVTSHLPENIDNSDLVGHWLESALFLTLINIRLIQQYSGSATHIVISGGLSEYDLLCQYLADLAQLPVKRLDDSQATLRGTAYVTAGRPAQWIKQHGSTFKPQTSLSLRQRFHHWQHQLQHWLQQHKQQDHQKLIWVSHRGDVQHFQENSIAGLSNAITQGVTELEFDIQLDRDGTPILLHDPDLSRVFQQSGSVFDYSHYQQAEHRKAQTETLWQLLNCIAQGAHLFIEVKHDSIDHWGISKVLDAIAPLLHTPHTYTLLARSQEFLAAARKQGHISIGANVREYNDAEHNRLQNLAPDYLVINHERIPANTRLWLGNWQWMIYEVATIEQALALQKSGANHMISFNACQYHHHLESPYAVL